jgi:hypothetical protein
VTSEAAESNAASQFTARVASPDLPAVDTLAIKVRNDTVLLKTFEWQ